MNMNNIINPQFQRRATPLLFAIILQGISNSQSSSRGTRVDLGVPPLRMTPYPQPTNRRIGASLLQQFMAHRPQSNNLTFLSASITLGSAMLWLFCFVAVKTLTECKIDRVLERWTDDRRLPFRGKTLHTHTKTVPLSKA